MDREQGIGALITGDGNELLFYRYTMVGTEFDQLMEGQIVRFVTISDADGVRAEIVQVSAPPAYHHHTPART
jgi:cold shock CspA family protein